jgi:hypothetical protein
LKNDNSINTYFRDIAADIADEKLPEIDFDLLSSRLTEASGRLQKAAGNTTELELLKSDYQTRISGMVKAMSAVDRKRGSLLSALETIDKLNEMSAAELLNTYRTTSAKFRDCFPVSFGSLSLATGIRSKDAADFK